MVALVRGLARRRSDTIGNFWVDLTAHAALPARRVHRRDRLVGPARSRTSTASTSIKTLEGNTQVIPGGPAAGQEAIKMIGTNGGGFFNANSAHPLTNPNGFTEPVPDLPALGDRVLADLHVRQAGRDQRQGYVLLAVMVTIWLSSPGSGTLFEAQRQPQARAPKVEPVVTSTQPGGNLEGKELRFGAPTPRLRRRDHRHVDRRGRLDARQLHASGRNDAAPAHQVR